jgi:acetyl-CoA carboxylase beta subunit
MAKTSAAVAHLDDVRAVAYVVVLDQPDGTAARLARFASLGVVDSGRTRRAVLLALPVARVAQKPPKPPANYPNALRVQLV